MTRPSRAAAWAIVAGAVLVVLLVSFGSERSRDAPEMSPVAAAEPTHLYVIPAGTGDRIDRGETVSVLPEQLTAHVGDVLRIVNHDDRGHLVGPFFVASDQTLSQRFESPGELVGACSVHSDGRFVLEVLP